MRGTSGLSQLLSVASPGLGPPGASIAPDAPGPLAALWEQRNGFVAYFGALQVFPLGVPAGGIPDAATVGATLHEAYGELVSGHHVFGHDLFGTLLSWHGDHVCLLDPETAEHEPLAADLDRWAAAVAGEPEATVGAAFAFDWQERHGALRAGERLVPLLPFVLGGEYDDLNLAPRASLAALRERAALARVLAALPEGAEVDWPLPAGSS